MTFAEYLEKRDFDLYAEMINEGAWDYIKSKASGVKDFFGEFWRRLKSDFGEFKDDAIKVKKAYDDGKLRPKQIDDIRSALNEKDQQGNVKANWGKIAKILAGAGVIILAGLTVGAGHSYAPTQHNIDYKYGNDSLMTHQNSDMKNLASGGPDSEYDVDSTSIVGDEDSTEIYGNMEKGDGRIGKVDGKLGVIGATRVQNTKDPTDLSVIHNDVPLKAPIADNASILPKDIKQSMNDLGLTSKSLNTSELSALSKDVSKLSSGDKYVLQNLNNKMAAFHNLKTKPTMDYLAHGMFGKTGTDSKFSVSNSDDLFKNMSLEKDGFLSKVGRIAKLPPQQ